MSEDTSNIEDVAEDTLVEEETEATEVVESTTEVTEDSVQEESSLSETVLSVLRGQSEESLEEAKAKKEEADDEDEEDEEEEVDEATKKEADEDEDDEDDDDIDEAVEGDDDEEEEEAPKTKAEVLNQMYKEMRGMKKSQLQAAFDKLSAFANQKDEAAFAPGDGEKAIAHDVKAIKKSADDAKKLNKGDLLQASYKIIKSMKKSDLQANYGKLKGMMKASYHMDESFDLESEVDLLVQADANLSEDFKQKAQVVFEAAIANKVYDIKASLEEQYNSDLQEELTHVRESLIEKIDSYLGYVVEAWTEENSEIVDAQLRTELAENFIKGLHGLFTESYIEVPEEKRDLVAELSEKVSLIEGSLEQAESDKEDLEEQLEDLLREKIIREHSQDLTSTQVEKLNHLLSGAEFVSEESFTDKVQTVKETFFSGSNTEEEVQEATETSGEVEVVVEGAADQPKTTIPAGMSRYVKALSGMNNSSFTN